MKSIWLRKSIGLFQVIGGFFGLIQIPFFARSNFNEISILYFLLYFTFFSFSILCGYLLYKDRKYGILVSKLNQYLQLLHFGTANGIVFGYFSGLFCAICLKMGSEISLDLDFNLLAGFEFQIWGDNNPYLKINLVAILLLWLIRKIKDNNLESQQIIEEEEALPKKKIDFDQFKIN